MSNVSTNTRKKKRRTYLMDLDISHRDSSDDDERRQPRCNDTFLYLRRVWQPTAIRGLVAERRLFLTQGKEKSLSDVSQLSVVRQGLRQSLAGKQEWGCMYEGQDCIACDNV
jgi:hypothetical protein